MTIIAEQPQAPVHFPQDQITYIRNMARKLSTEELEYRLNVFYMPLPSDREEQSTPPGKKDKISK